MITPDGKLVVLDFGLMTEITEEQRIALVEVRLCESVMSICTAIYVLGGCKLFPGPHPALRTSVLLCCRLKHWYHLQCLRIPRPVRRLSFSRSTLLT
jgi:hypothetical protein